MDSCLGISQRRQLFSINRISFTVGGGGWQARDKSRGIEKDQRTRTNLIGTLRVQRFGSPPKIPGTPSASAPRLCASSNPFITIGYYSEKIEDHCLSAHPCCYRTVFASAAVTPHLGTHLFVKSSEQPRRRKATPAQSSYLSAW